MVAQARGGWGCFGSSLEDMVREHFQIVDGSGGSFRKHANHSEYENLHSLIRISEVGQI
jgi:hypothetical protein